MGNQEIKAANKAVMEPGFENAEDLKGRYLGIAFKDIEAVDAKAFFAQCIQQGDLASSADDGVRHLSSAMRKCFPYNSSIDFENAENKEELWDQSARELWQTGYTQWQHNLASLQGDSFKNVVMGQNGNASKYEYLFYSRCMMLCSNFMHRHSGGTDVKDVMTYFRETFDQSSSDYGFITTAQTMFLSMMNGLVDNLLQNPQNLSKTIQSLFMATQGIPNGALFMRDKQGMQIDLLLKRIRAILLSILQSGASQELKAQCVELLMRIGIAAASPEDLILAAQFQFEFKIDISKHLEFFLSQSEVFEEPKSTEQEDTGDQFQMGEKKRIQNRCAYGGNGSDRQHIHDKMCCDGTSYFSFCSERGLSRATKTSDKAEWEHAKTDGSDDIKKLKFPTFLVHGELLYLRHLGAPNVPFQLLNKTEMTFAAEQEEIKAPAGEVNRFKWTTAEDPPIENDYGKRWMHVTPMASDGQNIYAIVPYREGGEKSTCKATFCEIYELKDNVICFKKDLELLNKDGKSWVPKPSKTDEGGYFDFGHLACNGKQLVWSSNKNYHVFSISTGEKLTKVKFHTGNHLTMYDPLQSNFYTCDADCYSWLDEWKIKGFKTVAIKDDEDGEEVEAKLPVIPVILDDPKSKIRKSLTKIKQPEFQLNLFAQLVGGQMETQATIEAEKFYTDERAKVAKDAADKKAEAGEEDKKDDEAEEAVEQNENWVFDYTRAIILAHISKVAQEKNFFARSQVKQLDGEAMLKFFKDKYGIQVSESIFKTLRFSMEKVLEGYQTSDANISARFTLKSLLHVYIAHIGCLRPLKISIRQIMSEEEMIEQQKLLTTLKKIDLFPNQAKNPNENDDIEEDKCFQLHIYHLARQAVNEMEDLISTQSIKEKLNDMLTKLEAFKDQEEDQEIVRMLKRYQEAEYTEVFGEEPETIQKFAEIFEVVCEQINTRLTKKMEEMFNDKTKIEDDFQGYGSEETQRMCEFSVNFLENLMVTYGNQKKAIIENQPIKDAGEDEIQNEMKKTRNLAKAEEMVEKLNDLLYNSMIVACKNFKIIIKKMSRFILSSSYTDFEENDYKLLFNKIDNLGTGKASLLKSILMFVMTIQLYEVGSTDLDEVAEALREAVEGLQFYTSASDTMHSLLPVIYEHNKNFYTDCVSSQRFVAFALNKVACRLANGKSESSEAVELSKFSILKNGIAEKFIPRLSEYCKKEIEGSFKITKDEEMRNSCQTGADAVVLSDKDQQLIDIMNNNGENIQKLTNVLKNTVKDESECDPIVEDLVRKTFATMVCFQNLFDDLNQALRIFEDSDDGSLLPESIRNAWTKAGKMRSWEHKTMDDLQQKLKPTVIEEFKKEYAEENPSKPALEGKLSDEHQVTVDERVNKQAKVELNKAFQESAKKCEFLLMFETENVVPKIEDDGIDVVDNVPHWADWDTKCAPNSKGKRAKTNDQQEEREKTEKIQNELIQIIQTQQTNAKELQDFTEGNQIRGLRRLAGMVMFNKTFMQNENEIFYDALHMFEASLRGNKGQLNHYLDGVPGCGARTERDIRRQFFKSINLISDKIKVESDPQKLVKLLNALLWDYQAEDMQVLAQAQIFRTLSGDIEYSYTKYNTIYNAWGQEQKYYSIENRDKSVQDNLEYCLSARLRQCFDFLTMKVFSVIYSNDQKFQTNDKLNKICSCLMQRIQKIVFDKFERHLNMLELSQAKAAQDRDEDIRFDNQTGEKPDDKEAYMVDQCTEYGKDCLNKVIKETQTKRKNELKVIEKYIQQYEQTDQSQVQFMDKNLLSSGMQIFDFDQEELDEALLSREWRVVNWAVENAGSLANTLQIEIGGDEEEEKAMATGEEEEEKVVEEKSDEDKIAAMKSEVDKKGNEKEKVEEWINQMKDQEGTDNPLQKANFFSRVSILRLLKPIILLCSLAESSRDASKLLKKVLAPNQLTILVRLSALGTSHVQCIIQKIFQNLLRCNLKKQYLDKAVQTAARDDQTMRVDELQRQICLQINFDSAFWTFNFNQIYLTKRAQYNTIDQVEVGKPAVVEEIIRTFVTQQSNKESEHSQIINAKIIEALKDIERSSDFEIATLFSLVPESHTPLISTGKRCRDVISGYDFICLGFAQSEKDHVYETKLSMMQCQKTQVIGLVINKGSQQTQVQKSFSLMNVNIVPDIDVSETVSGNVSPEEMKRLNRELTKSSSIYMNPEIVSQLLSRMTSKDAIMRNTPEKAIIQQFLQIYVLNGIFRMLEIFEKDYLIVLKSYNQLETLINFLSKEASLQMIKPEEDLVSASLLSQQVSEVFISATHTSRSTGFYAKFLIYIEEESKQGAILQRLTDDDNMSEFIDINVVSSYGDNNREPSKCEESHEISNIFGGGENDATVNCKLCKTSINSIHKASQKKTGYMRCLECTSDVFFCNDCKPMPQVREKMGLDAGIHSLNTFRIARHEAIFIKSEDLFAMTDTILTLMINSNVIITEKSQNAPLLTILENLAKKIESDNKWKLSATCRFIVVEDVDFQKACSFVKGEKVNQGINSRGSLLTRICNKVEIAQKRINNPSMTHAFVTKFLTEKNQPDNEFKSSTVPNILTEEIAKDFGEEAKEKQREEKKMNDQLKDIDEPPTSQLDNSDSIRNVTRSMVSTSGEKTPDFMKKFTDESDKLIEEGGKEFFNPVNIVKEQSVYRDRFDDIVFETDKSNPGELQRKQLKSCLGKINQILARSIWLRLMSEVTDGIDADTKNIINATAMHSKICDLIHESNMSASYQHIYFGDNRQKKTVRNQILKLLKYFDDQPEGTKFISFFVKDFLKRADNTIDQVKKDNYTELSSYKLKDLRKVSKLSNVFDPNNLMFLSTAIFGLEKFLVGNIKTEMAKVMFDLHLGFAILFKSEQDAMISQQLVMGCSWALDKLLENIDNFVASPDSANKLLRSDMIVRLFYFMEENSENTNKKKLINEIIIKLNKIFLATKKRNPDNSPAETPFKKTDQVKTMLDGYSALEHGSKFTSMMPRIKLLNLLNHSDHCAMVKQFGESYQTERQMFKTFYKKTFTPTQNIEISINSMTTKSAISIQNNSDKKAIIMDSKTFSEGKPNTLKVAANEEVTIEFPIAINDVKMSGKMMVRGGDDVLHEDYKPLPGIEAISASQVYARHHHAMFVSTDEQVMGIGYRACGKEENMHKLRILERPDNCTGYKKCCVGKFFRLILTHDGKLFFCGQNKKYMIGKEVDVNAHVSKFFEITNLFPMQSGDKIIDVDGGKHFMIVVTEKGKVYTSGYMMYRAASEIRSNSEENEDFPCELKMTTETEGWIPKQCWACDLYCNVWISCESSSDPTKHKIFAAGGDYDMVGCGDGTAAPKWRAPVFPEGIYMKTIASAGMSAYGIDQNDELWEWGDHKVKNQSGEDPLWEKVNGFDEKRSTPYKFVWFQKNNRKPIMVASGNSWCLLKTESTGPEKEIELFGWADDAKSGKFGKDTKDMYTEKFVLLGSQINHTDVVHFDCSKEASYLILLKAVESLPSLISDEPDYHKLVHFYNQKGVWQFIKEEDFGMRSDKIPTMVFATRHPIKAWEAIKNNTDLIPDLNKIIASGVTSKTKSPFMNVTTTNDNAAIAGSLYYAKYLVDGKLKEVVSTLQEVQEGGKNFDLQPLLFYVLKGPIVNHKLLPAINNDLIFHKSELDNEFLRFSITNSDVEADAIMNIEVPDQDFNDQFTQLGNFNKDADFELLRSIDKRVHDLNESDEIKNLRETQFDQSTFKLANDSAVKKMNHDLVQNRVDLLFRFSKSVDTLLPDTYFQENAFKGSIGDLIQQNQTLLLPSVKIRFFKEQLKTYWEQRANQINTPFRYNRKEAYDFLKLGIKSNPDFIHASTFGQLYQICLLKDAEFGMMANTGNSFDVGKDVEDFQASDLIGHEDPNAEHLCPAKHVLTIKTGGGSGHSCDMCRSSMNNDANANGFMRCQQCDYDACRNCIPASSFSKVKFVFRMLEEELMSDQLPLFIRTPNGRLQAGTKRDCYTVNPRMTNPEWMKCYQFIGAYMGRVMVQDHLWFGVPMAPTFWMMVQEKEKPTLQDFAKEDARLRKRLNKFEAAREMGSEWPEDEAWVWTDVNDQIVPISNEKAEQAVRREDYAEFCEALLEKLIGESTEQIKNINHGIKQILGDLNYIRSYLNWHDIMVLTETKALKQYDIELMTEKTIYINCQKEDSQIENFWKIFTALNYEDKKAYFNFVSGKSRMADVARRFTQEHRIRVDANLAEDETPKSKPSKFEIVLASNYSTYEQMQAKMLEAISMGCGLEPDRD